MRIFIIVIILGGILSCKSTNNTKLKEESTTTAAVDTSKSPDFIINKFGDKLPKIVKSDNQWKSELDPNEFYVLREKGTERAFTSELNNNKKAGLYVCAACNSVLFTSRTKFDSGTGWPSFSAPEDKNLITEDTDYDIGYARTEVLCARCGGHLGHVFPDGPEPTGLRYCINGVALDFVPELNNK